MVLPEIYDGVATWAEGVNVLALVKNGGPTGYSRFVTNTRNNLFYSWNYAAEVNKCIIRTTNNYINNLCDMVFVESDVGYVLYALVMAFPCQTDGCTSSCSTYSTIVSSQKTDIPINYALGVTPNTVSDLTLTPGDKLLTVDWTAPDNAPIFAYGISLYKGATKIVGGYINNFPFTINNLENGVQYTVDVQPVSDDYLFGTSTSKSGTPSGTPCVDPLCNINITG